MSYKATPVYVVMRHSFDPEDHWNAETMSYDPIAIFKDLETAEGNAEGYNLSMKETNVTNLYFYVKVTTLYE
jgi:hypothetical protein